MVPGERLGGFWDTAASSFAWWSCWKGQYGFWNLASFWDSALRTVLIHRWNWQNGCSWSLSQLGTSKRKRKRKKFLLRYGCTSWLQCWWVWERQDLFCRTLLTLKEEKIHMFLSETEEGLLHCLDSSSQSQKTSGWVLPPPCFVYPRRAADRSAGALCYQIMLLATSHFYGHGKIIIEATKCLYSFYYIVGLGMPASDTKTRRYLLLYNTGRLYSTFLGQVLNVGHPEYWKLYCAFFLHRFQL